MILSRCFGLVVMVLLLSACSLIQPQNLPKESTYVISGLYSSLLPMPLSIPIIPKQAKRKKTSILISVPIASPGYQSNAMVYVQMDYKLKKFAYNRWIGPPAEMLLPLLANSLRSYGYFKAVVTTPFVGLTTFRLDTKLLVLQQEFLKPISVVRLVLQAILVKSLSNRIVATGRFQITINASGNNPYSGVLAANRAAKILSERVAHFVSSNV